jgi:hypothetical protein
MPVSPLTLSSVLDAVAQPDCASFENLTAGKRDRMQRGRQHILMIGGIEDAGRALGAIDCRENSKTDLVDEARPKEGAIGDAPAINLEALDAELSVKDVQRKAEIECLGTGPSPEAKMWHSMGSGLIRLSVFEKAYIESANADISLGEDNGNDTHDTSRPSHNIKSLDPPYRKRNVGLRRRRFYLWTLWVYHVGGF